MSSLRRTCYDNRNNDEGLKLALDCLPEVRDDTAQKMALYQERMTRYCNQMVKLKRFNPRDMVLYGFTSHQMSKRREARPQLGGSIEGHPLFKKRELLLGGCEWETFTSSLECKAP